MRAVARFAMLHRGFDDLAFFLWSGWWRSRAARGAKFREATQRSRAEVAGEGPPRSLGCALRFPMSRLLASDAAAFGVPPSRTAVLD